MAQNVLDRVSETLSRLAGGTPTGGCLLEGCRFGSVYHGLCAAHYRRAIETGKPEPVKIVSDHRCAVRHCTKPPARGGAFCPFCTGYFASMKGGALSRLIDKETTFPEMDLPLEKVHPGSFSMRPDMTEESVRDLASSIEEEGQQSPILVIPDGKGGYLIVYGHRRWLASRLVPGRTTLWALVAPADTPRARLVALASAENFQRQWVPPFGVSAWIAKLRQQEEMTMEQIAGAMNMSVREVGRHLAALGSTHDRVLEAYLAGRISLRAAVKLSCMRRDNQTRALADVLAQGDRVEADRRAAAAARSELKTAFLAWLRNMGPRFTRKGGAKGPQTLCIKFSDMGELFDFYTTWVSRRRST